MDIITAHHADALVDYSGLSKTLGDLERGFSLLEFLDLCAVLEGIILHDRLLMVGAIFPSSTPSSQNERWSSLLKPLVDAGILVNAPSTASADPGPRPVGSRWGDLNVRADPRRGPALARSSELVVCYINRLTSATHCILMAHARCTRHPTLPE